MKATKFFAFLLPLLAVTAVFFGFKNSTKETGKVEYLQITAVESVVPGGLGRSRIIKTDASGSNLEEIKLENFYSLVGINFSNIRHNDKIITDKISDYVNEGWELQHITTGVESGIEKTGLFITRYLFMRKK